MKAIVLLIIAMLTFPIVSAGDFSVVLSPYTQSVCPSAHTSYELTVKNEANEKTPISIDVSDPVKNWSTVLPNNFVLDSGESKKVSIFVQPYYTANPEQIDFIITTKGTTSTPIKARLNILGCRGVELSAQKITSCEGSVINGFVTIKNTGSANDTFSLSTDKSWVDLQNKTVSVESNQSMQVPLTFNKPPIGSSIVKVNATSTVSYAKSSLNLAFDLERCFDVDVIKPQTPELCPGESSDISITLRNIGTKQDTYSVSTNDVIVSMKNATLTLGPNESTVISAKINLPKTARSDQSFTVNIEGNLKESYKQDIKVIPFDTCYSISTKLEKDQVAVRQSENTFTTLSLKNNGKFPSIINITSDTNWADPSKTQVTLGPNESQQIYLYVAPTFDIKDGKYDVKLNIASNDLNKTEIVNVYVNQQITEEKKEEIKVETNESGPVINTDMIKKPFENIIKYISSPILYLLDKL